MNVIYVCFNRMSKKWPLDLLLIGCHSSQKSLWLTMGKLFQCHILCNKLSNFNSACSVCGCVPILCFVIMYILYWLPYRPLILKVQLFKWHFLRIWFMSAIVIIQAWSLVDQVGVCFNCINLWIMCYSILYFTPPQKKRQFSRLTES